MTQVRRAVVALAFSIVAVACSKTQEEPAPLLEQCSSSDCSADGGDDDASSPTEPGLAGFVSPNDAGETTPVAGGGACPGVAVVYPAASALVPPDVPPCCSNGFEMGDPGVGTTYVLTSIDPKGSAAITLDVDIATYEEADRVTMTAASATTSATPIFDSCALKTWDLADTTGGKSRPPDASIRQFHVDVPAGTTTLTFDFAGVVSPAYIRTLGLCDFDVVSSKHDVSWRAVAAEADADTCSAVVDAGAADGASSIR